jgi:2-dehydro-3-deoxyphosphogluconate aldolase/(4S)-4-hydroxy-2-oxoglutarate aldolase
VTSDLVSELRRLRIVPIITIDDAARAVPLVDALEAGGLTSVEVTFRTPSADDALRRIAAERPHILLGAGTVLTTEQAARAKGIGVRFVLSPGLNRRVVEWCQGHDLPIFPGVCTPTDIEMALELGLTAVKVFPVEPMGGVTYLKAIAAPFPGLSFMPTGGIGPSNVDAYLAYDRVLAVGGSWMAPPAWIAAGAFDRVRDAARQAASAALAVTDGR